jgi:hypothetical protein
MTSTEGQVGFQEQLLEIRKGRISIAIRVLVGVIATLELLFASFAIGAYFGPGPLRPIEVVLGAGTAFAVGFIGALPLIRRRLQKGALFSAVFLEGRRAVRAVVFGEYFLLGPEIVLRPLVASVELEKDALVLRYQDPRYGGVVLRELTGDPKARERLAGMLR